MIYYLYHIINHGYFKHPIKDPPVHCDQQLTVEIPVIDNKSTNKQD